jgi:hypothetical protein
MTEQTIFQLIGSYGFPIAVSIYLLVYMRRSLDALKDVISKNTETMAKICEHLNVKEDK